jgi:hypothetical protein
MAVVFTGFVRLLLVKTDAFVVAGLAEYAKVADSTEDEQLIVETFGKFETHLHQ